MLTSDAVPGQGVAAARPPGALHQAAATQVGHDRLEELAGQVLGSGEASRRSPGRTLHWASARASMARTAYSVRAEMSTPPILASLASIKWSRSGLG